MKAAKEHARKLNQAKWFLLCELFDEHTTSLFKPWAIFNFMLAKTRNNQTVSNMALARDLTIRKITKTKSDLSSSLNRQRYHTNAFTKSKMSTRMN